MIRAILPSVSKASFLLGGTGLGEHGAGIPTHFAVGRATAATVVLEGTGGDPFTAVQMDCLPASAIESGTSELQSIIKSFCMASNDFVT